MTSKQTFVCYLSPLRLITLTFNGILFPFKNVNNPLVYLDLKLCCQDRVYKSVLHGCTSQLNPCSGNQLTHYCSALEQLESKSNQMQNPVFSQCYFKIAKIKTKYILKSIDVLQNIDFTMYLSSNCINSTISLTNNISNNFCCDC